MNFKQNNKQGAKFNRVKKALITGATGYIGSHLAELCMVHCSNVVAFDRYNPNNHWGCM